MRIGCVRRGRAGAERAGLGVFCSLLSMSACGASPPPTASTASAASTAASSAPSQAEPTIEPGSERDADVEPSLAVVGEQLSYAGRAVGGLGEAQRSRTLARARGKLDAAKKYWALEHPSAFPTTLPIELNAQQRVLLLRQLLDLATDAEFAKVELTVVAKSGNRRLSLTLSSPEGQSPRKPKLLHVSVAPKNRYLLTW